MISVDAILFWGVLALLCALFLFALYLDIFNVYVFTLEIIELRRAIRCLKEGIPYSRPCIPSAVIVVPFLLYIIFTLLTFTFSHSSKRNSELLIGLATLGAVFALVDVLLSAIFLITIRRLTGIRNRVFASRITDPFLEHLLHHRFEQAHTYLSPVGQTRYSPTTLEREWRQLEEAIGWVKSWRVSVLWFWSEAGDTFARLLYHLQGSRGQAEIELRLRAQEQHWQIEDFKTR